MNAGEWVEVHRAWHEDAYVHCDVCGRLIPARQWRFADAGRTLTACEPACQELYESYVKAGRHGHH